MLCIAVLVLEIDNGEGNGGGNGECGASPPHTSLFPNYNILNTFHNTPDTYHTLDNTQIPTTSDSQNDHHISNRSAVNIIEVI